MSTDRPIILLTLRPENSGVPWAIRLRRVLKSLLRQYEMRCVAVEVVEPAHEKRPGPTLTPAASAAPTPGQVRAIFSANEKVPR